MALPTCFASKHFTTKQFEREGFDRHRPVTDIHRLDLRKAAAEGAAIGRHDGRVPDQAGNLF